MYIVIGLILILGIVIINSKKHTEEIPNQEFGSIGTKIISSISNENIKWFHYLTPSETTSFLSDTNSLITSPQQISKPFWDIRYTNKFKEIPNIGHGKYTGFNSPEKTIGTSTASSNAGGSVVQYSQSPLKGGFTINLWDTPSQSLDFGGPASTFAYRLKDTFPWRVGNLMMQASFNPIVYLNHSANLGGTSSFNVFLFNYKLNKRINIVISNYVYGTASSDENKTMQFDGSTQTIYVSTSIKNNNSYCTKSPYSKETSVASTTSSSNNTYPDFFRVNITRNNLKNILNEISKNDDFGNSPEDWELTTIMLQFELEEAGGPATISGSFKEFEAYESSLPS